MLITLQSNSDADASDFVNYFKETIMIEPKSELSLVNISYKFENGITIKEGVNDEFDVSLGQNNDLGTVTVAPGEYTTDADFATACQAALHTHINSLTYWKKQAFPVASQTFVIDGAATDRLKITLQYDPQEWNNALVGTATSGAIRQQAFGSNVGILPDFNKGIIKRITGGVNPGVYNTDNWNSGTTDTQVDTNVIWATARDTNQAVQHGKIAWKGYRTNSVEWVVGAADGVIPNTAAQWQNGNPVLPIAVRCLANGNLRISERSSQNGNLATIKDNIPVADGNDIEIHFDQLTTGSADTYAKYYVGGTEVVIDGSVDRWVLKPGLSLVPCGSFKTPNIVSALVDGGATFAVPSCIKTFDFTPGSGYCNGEIVSVTGGGGGTTTLLATTNAAGEILTLSFQEHGGNFDPNTDNALTITGLMSGRTTATLDVSTVDNSIVITNGGTNYNANNADLVIGGTTYPNAINITTVNAGVIEDFTIINRLINEGLLEDTVAEIHEGGHTDARITISAVNAESNLIYNVITDTTDRTVDEPLGLHNRATFRPSPGFSQTTSMNAAGPAAATPLTTTGSAGINDGREDTLMLVNIEEFMLKSICKEGGIQKAVASVPYGLTQPYFESGDPVKVDGEFYYEPYNMLYHDLSNPGVENHNQLRVRITDAVGNPIKQLQHPTTLTLDLRPRAK